MALVGRRRVAAPGDADARANLPVNLPLFINLVLGGVRYGEWDRQHRRTDPSVHDRRVYRPLWHIEEFFRMSKPDLQRWSIYHHECESIETQLAIVFPALAFTYETETKTDWSISPRRQFAHEVCRVKALGF